jgi:hypothetical protein
VEHIPAIHAAKVGMRYPASVRESHVWGLILDLDLTHRAPGRSPHLGAVLIFRKTLSVERARALCAGQRTEVVLIEAVASDGRATASLPADPVWLTWNNGTVRQLAQRIRGTGEIVLLPVLADALEEAGCTEITLLDRCRHPADDYLSWVVELLAAQE